MSTISDHGHPPPDDPFYYGFRYVNRRLRSGRIKTTEVPLTLEDILHPGEEDCTPQTHPHSEDVHYLRHAITWLATDAAAGAIVLSKCRVAWDAPGVRPMAPDAVVFFGIPRRKDWFTFDVAAERTRPELVVEVTSPKTRELDLVVRPPLYYEAGVPFYAIVDEVSIGKKGRRLRLLAYRREEGGYVKVPASSQGRLWLPPVKGWLGVANGRVVCFDSRHRRISTGAEWIAEQRLRQSLEHGRGGRIT